ncbi:MAG: pimeloyl-ACP methyl ester esterase BioH [Nitrosomonas sp.]|nr:pimeloyl-ACP methyl ester esterase BioH [Nitrosomonas sp.]
MSTQTHSTGAQKLFTQSEGSGPDLVMLHGWGMHSGIWDSVAPQLARRFRVLRIDLPGHGFSHASPLNSLENLAADIVSCLPASSIVCGWSLGGQLALTLARRWPDRINQLVLVSTTPCFTKRADWAWGMDTATLQLFKENLDRHYLQTLQRFLALQVRGGIDQSAVLAQLRKRLLQRGQPASQALQAGLEILLLSDSRAQLPKITQPATLIHGENDVITPVDAACWMQQQLPRARLKRIPHCGHAPFLSFPDLFMECFDDL